MSHRLTHPAENGPDEPDREGSSPESDEGEPEPRLRVLWGRFVVLGVVLVLAFLAGRTTAPTAPSRSELEDARAQLGAAREEIERLQADVAEEPEPAPTVTITPEAEAAKPAEEPAGKGETYVVKSGDTLQGIAEKFYENPQLDDVIAEVNDIADPSLLAPGTELIIPERPEL
jgi:nucleoid-associated protein YgaU